MVVKFCASEMAGAKRAKSRVRIGLVYAKTIFMDKNFILTA
jgi:hypothetical protein